MASTYPFSTTTKKFYFPYDKIGEIALYSRVKQLTTGYLLDVDDGIFKDPLDANSKITLIEDQPSVYYFTENREIWDDGEYQAYAYNSYDELFSVAQMSIYHNREIVMSDIQYELYEMDHDMREFLIPVYIVPGEVVDPDDFYDI